MGPATPRGCCGAGALLPPLWGQPGLAAEAGELVPLAEGADGKGRTERRLTASRGSACRSSGSPAALERREGTADGSLTEIAVLARRVSLSSLVFVLHRKKLPVHHRTPRAPQTPFLGALTSPCFRRVEGDGLEGTRVAPAARCPNGALRNPAVFVPGPCYGENTFSLTTARPPGSPRSSLA